jgi:hypothetical protein
MRTSGFGRCALFSCVAVAMLAGCGGPTLTTGGATAQVAATTREGKGHDLLYLGYNQGYVDILTYPGERYVAKAALPIASIVEKFCSDSQGDVFITVDQGSGSDATSYVFEYAHGATEPRQTLTIASFNVTSCGVDPKTGDLAVGGWTGSEESTTSSVAVFAGAQGQPKFYTDGAFSYFGSCTYDDIGDLFVGGNGHGATLAEIPYGSSTFTNISLQPKYESGDVQWDGSYPTLLVLSYHRGRPRYEILRLQLNGSTATVVGVTGLADGGRILNQTLIQGSTVISAPRNEYKPPEVFLWHYPSGGPPFRKKRISEARGSSGVAVSLATH